jgi:hypothetical protein
MDTNAVRMYSQLALVAWSVAEGIVLVLARGHATQTAGVRWALLGLACFALWMFLSALTIRDTAVFPREQLVWAFATVEFGAATGAWGWLWVNVRHSFRVSFGRSGRSGAV